MASLNKVILIGNLGSDPEIRSLPSGAKVASFSIATSESYTDKATGAKQTITEWHRLELWDGLAGIAEKYIKKGDSIYVEGRIRTDKWTDNNNVEKTTTKIRVTELKMLGGGRQTGAESSAPRAVPEMSDHSAPDMSDDLPF